MLLQYSNYLSILVLNDIDLIIFKENNNKNGFVVFINSNCNFQQQSTSYNIHLSNDKGNWMSLYFD